MIKIKEHYQEAVVPQLKKQFGNTNDLQVPRLEKVVINMVLEKQPRMAKQ